MIIFDVPGTKVVAPTLGIGDLVFLAARLELPIPALVPIGAAVIVCLPEARRLRREDRPTAAVAVAIAAAVVTGVLGSKR